MHGRSLEHNEEGIYIMKRRCQLFRFVTVHILPYRGHAVAQLFETLLYKQEGRGIDSRWHDELFIAKSIKLT